MEKSETIGKLSLALSKVQSQLRPAKENSTNPFFKSSYADLGSVWDSVRKLLSDNELCIIQMPTDVGGVTTFLSHSSGEWISSTCFIPAKEDAHGVGSAISYLYVSITDSVIVHHKDKNANIICNTLISPDKGGMSVLIIQNNIENVKIYRDIIFSNLETIIPLDAEYKIIGIL